MERISPKDLVIPSKISSCQYSMGSSRSLIQIGAWDRKSLFKSRLEVHFCRIRVDLPNDQFPAQWIQKNSSEQENSKDMKPLAIAVTSTFPLRSHFLLVKALTTSMLSHGPINLPTRVFATPRMLWSMISRGTSRENIPFSLLDLSMTLGKFDLPNGLAPKRFDQHPQTPDDPPP